MINNKDSIKFPTKKALCVDFVSTLSQNANILVFQFAFGFGGLETTSSEHLRTFSRTLSEIFGSGCYVFGNPGHDETKISHIYLRKSWQVYNCNYYMNGTGVNVDLIELKTPDIYFC